MKRLRIFLLTLAVALFLAGAAQAAYVGKVVDAKTKAPVEGAILTLGAEVAHTGKDGTFRIESSGETLKLRAPGYARREIATAELKEPNSEIPLTPFNPRALYLTVYGAWSTKIREAVLETVEKNKMNALVIDIKGDRGYIPFKVDIPLAEEVRAHAGAEKTILFKDMKAFVAGLKEKGLYLIARIVVFKDDPLVAVKPQWAVKVQGGGVFKDRERLRWVDPFNKEVWNYNIAIAKIGAELGFDEIQFDYVRCPDKKGVV
ncbi:MAG: GTP-binding protein, partial [Deltaproteobacteria bacterium]|nr:GTP-binding protein [Deltaproteobacteria bacterium]